MYYIYIMANKAFGTLYISVTNDLKRRVYEHKNGIYEGFSKKYDLNRLVYFEDIEDIAMEVQREKTLKHWLRRWKVNAIVKHNPLWRDLSDDWTEYDAAL